MADNTPLSIPIPTRPTPEVLDTLFFELVDTLKSDYVRLTEGSEHPNTAEYPGFKLVKEEFVSYDKNRRWWTRGFSNQDKYNYDIGLSAESAAHPIFARRYIERRDTYVPRTKGQPLLAIYGYAVTNAGSGYDPEVPPTVTVTSSEMQVSGGTQDGVYLIGPYSEGKPAFGLGGDGISADLNLQWVANLADYSATPNSPGWAAMNANTEGLIYYSLSNVADPSLATDWKNASDDSPAGITVAAIGSGATAVAVVNPSGSISWIQVVTEGDGYTSDPAVNISGAGGATAIVARQNNSAVLTQEEMSELPLDDPRASLYVALRRVWETLPGPLLPSRSWASGGLQQVTTAQRVAAATTLTGGTNVGVENIVPESTVVALARKETWLSPTGEVLGAGQAKYTIETIDGETGCPIYHTFVVVAANYVLPLQGSAYGSDTPYGTPNSTDPKDGSVHQAVLHTVEGSPNSIAEIIWSALPSPRVIELPSFNYEYPGVLEVLSDWLNADNSPVPFRRPYEGVDYNYLPPRVLSTTGRHSVRYGIGPVGFLPREYQVLTPGASSKAYPFIRQPSIHPPILLRYIPANGGVIVTVEDIEGSTPRTYDPFSVLIAKAFARIWRGNIYEYHTVEVSERTNAQNFPALQFLTPFRAISPVTLVRRMADLGYNEGTRLTVVSTSAADTTQVLSIDGKDDGGFDFVPDDAVEAITLSGTTRNQGSVTWWRLFAMQLSAAAVGTVTVRTEGDGNSGSVIFNGAPATTNTFTIDRNGSARVYAFTSPEKTKLTFTAKSGLNTGATPADYFRIYRLAADGVTIESVAFWANTDGLVTAPGVATREIEVDVQDPAIITAEQVLAAFKAAFIADGGWFVYQYTGETTALHFIDRFMGTRTDASLSGGSPWTVLVETQGIAQAANQVRLLPTPLGGTTEAQPENATALASALTNDSTAIAAAITAGYLGTATTALAYVISATADGATVDIEGDTTVDPNTESWTFSTTAGSQLTLVQMQGGSDGQIVATFQPGEINAYRDVDFWNPDLADNNLPATVVTTEALATGHRTVQLILIADGKPAIPVGYQVSTDGIVWIPGLQSLPDLAKGRIRTITPETTLTILGTPYPVNFMRLEFNALSSDKARAVHAVIATNYTDQ